MYFVEILFKDTNEVKDEQIFGAPSDKIAILAVERDLAEYRHKYSPREISVHLKNWDEIIQTW